MGLKRRAFLQRASLALTALGVSEAGLSLWASRYQQALAQPTRRKLALLVGINQYPEQVCDRLPAHGSALNGCITDVQLQRELLFYRFGFQAADIVTLTDQEATRDGIETAFVSHLVEQARPGDVVVFHFSGFGSGVRLDGSDGGIQRSLVPIDGVLPTEDQPAVNDLLLDTVGLLLRSLQTEQVVAVLDASYVEADSIMQGNLRVRSRPSTPTGRISDVELAFQTQLLERARVSKDQIRNQWQTGQLPGVTITAAGPNQIAAEGQWSGFSAGLLTYFLTQQLWSASPSTSLRTIFTRTVSSVGQVVGKEQQPRLSGQKSQNQSLPPYYVAPDVAMGADGVVIAVEEDGKTASVWMAGLPAVVLENYGVNSILSLYQPYSAGSGVPGGMSTPDTTLGSPTGLAASLLQARSRDGVTARVKICCTDAVAPSSPSVGQLVQEYVRVLPRNIGLTIALDASLERIERVDATSAFSSIPRVSSVIAGEQPADYLFGKTQFSANPTLATAFSTDQSSQESGSVSDRWIGDLPPLKSSYGLFNLGRSAIPNTLIAGDEAVKTAVNRITPHLQTLLAAKLLRLTENSNSSRLGVQATLELVAPQERMILQRETVRAPWVAPESRLAALFSGEGELPTLTAGSRVQYRLCNYSDRPVYFLLLGLDSAGNAIALYPTPLNSSADPRATPMDGLLQPGEILLVPQSTPTSNWIVQGPAGVAENHLIFSSLPLVQTFSSLKSSMRSKGDARRVSVVSNPLEVIQSVLQDLHQASLETGAKLDSPPDTYALNVNAWATLSFVYQIVEG